MIRQSVYLHGDQDLAILWRYKRPDGDNEDDRHLPPTETSLDELLVGEGGCADQASLKIPKANIFGKVITLNYN